MTLLDRLWEETEPLVFISKAEFIRNLDGWAIEPVYIGGTLAVATMTKGAAFHFHSFKTGTKIPRQMIKEFVQNIIDQHGHATTKTPKDQTKQIRFNRLFGFEQVGEDEFDVHFRIETIR